MPTPREMYEEAQRRKEAKKRAMKTGAPLHESQSSAAGSYASDMYSASNAPSKHDNVQSTTSYSDSPYPSSEMRTRRRREVVSYRNESISDFSDVPHSGQTNLSTSQNVSTSASKGDSNDFLIDREKEQEQTSVGQSFEIDEEIKNQENGKDAQVSYNENLHEELSENSESTVSFAQHARHTITTWRMRAAGACGIIMVLGCIIGLLFFLRPTTSALEMRNLTQFPAFTMQSFLDGSFFTKVSLWYSDTYPLREPMVAADRRIDMLFGISTETAMVGGNVKVDEIPDETSGDNTVPVEVLPPAEAPDEKVVAEDIQGNIMSGVYIKNGAGYSIYYFSKNAADTYIAAMNKAAERLDGKAKVYSIMAPANSITLPDEEAAQVGGSDQQQALDYLSTRFDSRVTPVDLIEIIKNHRNEYLYFKTDHHWTQLGAYYAYVAFCEKKGVTPIELSSMEKVNLGEFVGTYYGTIESKGFTTKDTIDAYIPSSTNEMDYVSLYGVETKGSIIDLQARDWDPSFKYSAFAAGDQPLEVIHNPKVQDGSSCLIVKDSYGCAFVPNLVDQYETIHVIDFRSTDKNICDYVLENEIKEVLFMTGMKIGLTDTVAQTLLSEVQ